MAAFADADDMIVRYDTRTLGDICSDTGDRVTEGDLENNAKMTAALNSATGQIKAAVLRGERYSTADLEALTGESQAYLVDITCQIAFWNLWRRKPYTDNQQRIDARQAAEESLEMLRKGDHVFDVDDAKDAGLPKIETVTRTDIRTNWNLFVDRARGRLYPRRRTFKDR